MDTATAATAATDLLNGQLGNIVNFLSAAAGLGTAAMGVVDASKVFWGGPSNFGFGYVRDALGPYLRPQGGEPAAFGPAEVLRTLKSNWLNGVAKADQKAKAKSLIHLELTRGHAAVLAAAAGVDAATLESLARKTAAGKEASAHEINVLGQFDAVLSAVLDAAYERADQKYRNASKLLAMLVATVFAALGGWLVFAGGAADAGAYLGSRSFWLSILVGLSATPLAPMAKDLATALQSAVSAVRAVRR